MELTAGRVPCILHFKKGFVCSTVVRLSCPLPLFTSMWNCGGLRNGCARGEAKISPFPHMIKCVTMFENSHASLRSRPPDSVNPHQYGRDKLLHHFHLPFLDRRQCVT